MCRVSAEAQRRSTVSDLKSLHTASLSPLHLWDAVGSVFFRPHRLRLLTTMLTAACGVMLIRTWNIVIDVSAAVWCYGVGQMPFFLSSLDAPLPQSELIIGNILLKPAVLLSVKSLGNIIWPEMSVKKFWVIKMYPWGTEGIFTVSNFTHTLGWATLVWIKVLDQIAMFRTILLVELQSNIQLVYVQCKHTERQHTESKSVNVSETLWKFLCASTLQT